MYTDMNEPNKRKQRHTLCEPQLENASSRSLTILSLIEGVTVNTAADESQQAIQIITQKLSELLNTVMKKFTILSSINALILLPDVVDSSQQAYLKCQNIQHLEEGIMKILYMKNVIKDMSYVLVTTVKIQTQVNQFDFKELILKTTTNIAEI